MSEMTGTRGGRFGETEPYGTDYYYVKGKRIPLERHPQVFAVRFKTMVRDDSPVLSASARRMLREECEPVAFIANYGLRVLRSTQPRSVTSQLVPVGRLDAEEGIDQAVLAFRRSVGAAELMFTTRRFIVQFRPDVDRDAIDALNARHAVRIVAPTSYMSNGFVLEAPSGEGPTGPVALANGYVEAGLVLSATPDFVRAIHTKQVTAAGRSAAVADRDASRLVTSRADDHLAQQWHLTTARVVEAWEVTAGDPAIVVAILDDGVDVDHAEFAGKVVGQSDFADRISDARPKSPSDKHGTACAGVAVARGARSYGAAPDCSLLAVRTPEFLGVADEAEMFRWVCDQGADVISCSWGPADGTGATDPLPDNVRSAIRYCLTDGRKGRGIPIVWAAGNGNESVSLDGYASNPDVIGIGASTSRDTRSWYSDFGPEVWICAPSSGSSADGDRRVFTTDRSGAEGYNPGDIAAGDTAGDYTNDFGGTSSAAPLVAGVIGLMLSANPSLTHQDIRSILRTTATRIGEPTSYNASGHSPLFGFGRLDAKKAVDAAKGGRGTLPQPAGKPEITAPGEVSRSDPAPVFSVNPGNNPRYAVEIGTQWQLFDGANDSERTPQKFHSSWESGPLLTAPTYAMPTDAWQNMKHADRLYYRVHSAQDENWTGWQVSTADADAASAPSIEITPGSIDHGERPRSTQPSITGPVTAERNGRTPTFLVDTAGRPWYAIEVTVDPALFAAGQESQRTPATHWGSWQDLDMLSGPSFELPLPRWNELRAANALYYRVHVAEDREWNGWAVSTPDEQSTAAPFVTLRDGGGSAIDGHVEVVYPNSTFQVAATIDDGIDYTDSVSGGAVPLINVHGRLDDRLSPNFAVRELAARRVNAQAEFADYARISPDLVRGLQAMRDELGRAISVNSGYRYPVLNDDVDGAGQSQHMTGRAADIRCPGIEPLELARTALKVLGSDIGLGLGRTIVHVDLRGDRASWVYSGAALSEADFDAWVRTTVAELGRSATPRQDVADRTRPWITGPSTVAASSTPPVFAVGPGPFPYFGVELASDWAAFADPPGDFRSDVGDHFASWHSGGMRLAGSGESSSYQLPEGDWARWASHERVYYRAVCSATGDIFDATVSLPLEEAEDAPYLRMTRDRVDRTDELAGLADPAATRRTDEGRWRSERAAYGGRPWSP